MKGKLLPGSSLRQCDVCKGYSVWIRWDADRAAYLCSDCRGGKA